MSDPDLILGKYEITVLAAYGAALVLILALVGLTRWRGRRVRRALEAAEARLVRNQGN